MTACCVNSEWNDGNNPSVNLTYGTTSTCVLESGSVYSYEYEPLVTIKGKWTGLGLRNYQLPDAPTRKVFEVTTDPAVHVALGCYGHVNPCAA